MSDWVSREEAARVVSDICWANDVPEKVRGKLIGGILARNKLPSVKAVSRWNEDGSCGACGCPGEKQTRHCPVCGAKMRG